MAFEDLVFKSKAQAEKLREVFAERYGKELGAKKYAQVEKRSPKMVDLPDRIEPIAKLYSGKKPNISRKYGKKWRGI